MNMSHSKKKKKKAPPKKYTNGLITRTKIIILLAKNKDSPQYDMPKKIGITRRQVIRCLRDLKKRNLIYLARTEPSDKGGTPKNIWQITFEGIMEVLAYLNIKEINRVADLHKDKWIVFSELPFIIKKFFGIEASRPMFYKALQSLSMRFNSLECDLPPPFGKEEIYSIMLASATIFDEKVNKKEIEQKSTRIAEAAKASEKEIRLHVREATKDACTNEALGVHYLTNPVEFFLNFDSWGLDEKTRKFWWKNQRRRLTKLLENETFKNYLFEQFKKAEKSFMSLKLLDPFQGGED